jgi:hypothetical protein
MNLIIYLFIYLFIYFYKFFYFVVALALSTGTLLIRGGLTRDVIHVFEVGLLYLVQKFGWDSD